MRTLNLGIVAHVDAGKTSLTEQLLHAAGVIDEIGRVDDGSTQTDSLALERRRGITIKSAVVSFEVDGVTVNLIDTPGHPDFIAEVERVLGVFDGVVLVVSAVEGVQAQTRVLMRTLQRLRIPTLIVVNKIDRAGAHDDRVLHDISEKLTPAIIAMGSVSRLGTRGAAATPHTAADAGFAARLVDLVADHDHALLAAYVDDEAAVSHARLRAALAAQTQQALVHPAYFVSAITGAGVHALIGGITNLLPATQGDVEAPAAGAVFKVDGSSGDKVAYVRMFSGVARARERLPYGQDREGKVTAISVFEHGSAVQRTSVAAGQIGTIRGLDEVQVGDTIGTAPTTSDGHHFAPPTLETVIVPARAGEKGALHAALAQLAEQDPLINLRQDDVRQELLVSLYGEVQKEVIQSTLADDFGIEVTFRGSTAICVERPIGVGSAVERAPTPFVATVGLRVEPAPVGSGVDFRLEVEFGSVPTSFLTAVEDSVHQTLRQGLSGWQVTDCTVTMTESIRYRDFASSTPAEHRKVTPLVVMRALAQAGTQVLEPVHRYHLEVPTDVLGAVLPVLGRLRAAPQTSVMQEASYLLQGAVPAARVHELQQLLPELTRGEAVLESALDHYQPVQGAAPTRPRTDDNPLDREEYLLHVLRRV